MSADYELTEPSKPKRHTACCPVGAATAVEDWLGSDEAQRRLSDALRTVPVAVMGASQTFSDEAAAAILAALGATHES